MIQGIGPREWARFMVVAQWCQDALIEGNELEHAISGSDAESASITALYPVVSGKDHRIVLLGKLAWPDRYVDVVFGSDVGDYRHDSEHDVRLNLWSWLFEPMTVTEGPSGHFARDEWGVVWTKLEGARFGLPRLLPTVSDRRPPRSWAAAVISDSGSDGFSYAAVAGWM